MDFQINMALNMYKMKKATFSNTVSILVKAYMNDTLVHGNCYACAVGNIVAEGLGTRVIKNGPYVNSLKWDNGEGYPAENGSNPGWGKLFSTNRNDIGYGKKQLIDVSVVDHPNVRRQIDSTGYHWTDLAKIEKAFEGVDFRRKDKVFLGLMAVLETLAEIHGVDLTTKEEAKKLFIKA